MYARSRHSFGGIAHTAAQQVADTAREAASLASRASIMDRFATTGPSALRRLGDINSRTAIAHPVLGTVAFAALRDVALVEATKHLLDLIDAIGGPPPSEAALAATCTILTDVCGASAFLDAATGRAKDPLLPIIR